jgi:hypothetical protein
MGKTHRFDPRDADSAADYSEPMALTLYTHGDADTTLADATVPKATVVDVVPGCDRVRVGDVYRLSEGATVTEAWVTGQGDARGEFLALVTVQRGSAHLASRLLSLPESFLSGMTLADFQAVNEAAEPTIIDATG